MINQDVESADLVERCQALLVSFENKMRSPPGSALRESPLTPNDPAAIAYLAERMTHLLCLTRDLLPWLPTEEDALNYAATNEGRAAPAQTAAVLLRRWLYDNKVSTNG